MNNIGEKIRKIRDLKGFSQENMADMLGLSLPAYADIERGKKEVTLSRLEKIAEKLGVTLNDVLNFDDRLANFFDQCSANINAGVSPTQTNNYHSQRELLHQIELLQLELKLCQSEKGKVETELNYLKQKLNDRAID